MVCSGFRVSERVYWRSWRVENGELGAHMTGWVGVYVCSIYSTPSPIVWAHTDTRASIRARALAETIGAPRLRDCARPLMCVCVCARETPIHISPAGIQPEFAHVCVYANTQLVYVHINGNRESAPGTRACWRRLVREREALACACAELRRC